MPSLKQLQASRANGARSRGPVTAPGKLNSSKNSLRHGLLSRTVVLEEENPKRFAELLTALFDEHQPRTSTEVMLVETMAVARWRLLRIWGLQKAAIDREMALQDPSIGPAAVRALAAFRTFPDTSCSPELLLRYEIAFDRQFNRALARLIALRSQPSPAPPVPYHPEFPSGQTWNDDPPAQDHHPELPQPHEATKSGQSLLVGTPKSGCKPPERTQQTLETEPRPSGSGIPLSPTRIKDDRPVQDGDPDRVGATRSRQSPPSIVRDRTAQGQAAKA